MKLKEQSFLFVDCQTTGMRPPAGHLLEIAWAYTDCDSELGIQSHLISLPEEHGIPPRVSEITGIEAADLDGAPALDEVFGAFCQTLGSEVDTVTSVIHYAQFERPFLADMFERCGGRPLPFEILCSHQLAKRLFPNLPSQNIRGAAGFFGASAGPLKRASAHVQATRRIWRALVEELEKQDVTELAGLREWLKVAPRAKRSVYQYRLDRLKRLKLPDKPGVYRMLTKSGDILYVGKATSLKSRVNSYFRGQKGKQKREMLAQVWDLRVTECETPLEAALLESDEIKRINPPYNVVLKRGRRHLVFYNRHFSDARVEQTADFSVGPFRNSNWIEHLRMVARSLTDSSEFEQVFFDPIPPENLRAGFELFCALNGVVLEDLRGVRSLLATGMWLLKNYVEPEEEEPEEDAETDELDEELDEDRELTVEEIAGKFERLLRRAAAEYRRSKKMTRMLNADVVLRLKSGERRLGFRGGNLSDSARASNELPWSGLKIDDFDRMSILLSELNKYDHIIEYAPFEP